MTKITVISAEVLDSVTKKKLEEVFKRKHNNEAEFIYEVDKGVLGGILVIDGNNYYEATLKGQLANMEKSYLNKNNSAIVNNNEIKTIEKQLRSDVKNFNVSYDTSPSGRIIYAGDGVVKISGLADAKYGELLDIGGHVQAIVLSLEQDEVGAIILDDEDSVSANMIAKATGKIVQVPVGYELLGRVVNPLGKPMDGLGAISKAKMRPIEHTAPQIRDRGKVNEPLQTGILAIDSMIPIGRGQRELIIGDRQTGKTSIAIDTIINQKGKDVYCIYVAIGQKASSISSITNLLTEHGCMGYTTIVCSTANDSSPMQYIAPYAGCAMAEELMSQGKHVLIIYDDLSKHAVAYRAMSLLLKRPPGREAFPGDIFYLHSRLLERAAKMSDEQGGGSITALPIVETLAGDISAYVPTNIISITDGQIYLESELFNSGVRPAINVGLSVSRVGSSAQIKGMKKVSGKLRLDLSQYRELAIFAQFGSDLDASTTAQLEQGQRTTEALKQDVNSPLDVEHQIILLYITMKELLKKIPIKRICEFKSGFIDYIDVNCVDIIEHIKENKDLNMEMGIKLEEAVERYSDYFFEVACPVIKKVVEQNI